MYSEFEEEMQQRMREALLDLLNGFDVKMSKEDEELLKKIKESDSKLD